MIFLYEDSREYYISKLILNNFDVSNDFGKTGQLKPIRQYDFTGGNGNLKKRYKKCIDSDDVTIFIDLPFGNRNIVELFNQLVTIKPPNGHTLTIIPFMSIEYSMIDYLHSLKFYKDETQRIYQQELLDIIPVLKELSIKDNKYNQGHGERRTLEQVSKYILSDYTIRCLDDSSDCSFIHDSKECKNNSCFRSSKKKVDCGTVSEKSEGLLRKLPCYPSTQNSTIQDPSLTAYITDMCNTTVDICNLGNQILSMKEHYPDYAALRYPENTNFCVDVYDRSYLKRLHAVRDRLILLKQTSCDGLEEASNDEIDPTSLFAEIK